jgi:hypothetical protein
MPCKQEQFPIRPDDALSSLLELILVQPKRHYDGRNVAAVGFAAGKVSGEKTQQIVSSSLLTRP